MLRSSTNNPYLLSMNNLLQQPSTRVMDTQLLQIRASPSSMAPLTQGKCNPLQLPVIPAQGVRRDGLVGDRRLLLAGEAF